MRLKRQLGTVGSAATRQVSRGHSRARAPHPGRRSAQLERRSARAARGAGRRARFVRRAHAADVRLPGARVPVGHDARVLVQDRPRRVEPRRIPESGTDKGFHPASHHGGRESAILDFNKINRYHVSMLPYFLDKLKNTMDGDKSLLDKTMIMYGSPMADGNIHNHRRCPLAAARPRERHARRATCISRRPTERRWPT